MRQEGNQEAAMSLISREKSAWEDRCNDCSDA